MVTESDPIDRRDLAARYVPFARALAEPFKLANPAEAEDIDGYALLGLTEAAAKFDPDRGVKFPTFAKVYVRGRVVDYLRAEALHKERTRALRRAARTFRSRSDGTC